MSSETLDEMRERIDSIESELGGIQGDLCGEPDLEGMRIGLHQLFDLAETLEFRIADIRDRLEAVEEEVSNNG